MLTEEQLKVLDYVSNMDKNNYNNPIVLVDSIAGSGKEQPLYSKVLTPNGWVRMGDLKIGDKLVNPENIPSKVVAIHPQGKKEVYKIHFSDKSVVECGLEHLWKVKSKNWGKDEWRVLTVRELLKTKLKNSNGYIYEIPYSEPIEFSKKDLQINPYILGVLLADGSLTQSTKYFSFHEKDVFIFDKIKNILNKQQILNKPRYTSNRGKQVSFTRRSMDKNLDELGINYLYSHQKFIPKAYLYSSVEDRVNLLRGLMDCDGYISKNKNKVTYSTSSIELANDIVSLVRSLGEQAYIGNIDTRRKNYNYIIRIKCHNFCPFSLPRKKELWHPPKQNRKRKAIVKIEKTGKFVEQQCITVSAPNNLYITDGYAVTHNTHLAYNIVKKVEPKKGLYTAFNKAIVEEGKDVFDNLIECRTLHSLAYGYVKPERVGELMYSDINPSLDYIHRKIVKDVIDDFCRSESVDLDDFIEQNVKKQLEYVHTILNIDISKEHENKLAFKITIEIKNIIDKMQQEKLPMSFNFMLKILHLLLVNKEIDIEYDMLIFDEINDSTGVSLEIFKLIKAPIKIGLGEKHQQIYRFLNLVNGFVVLKNTTNFKLTKTFRCSIDIANEIEKFGKKYLDRNFKFTGTKDPSSDGKIAYITATNSEIILRIKDLIAQNKMFKTVRPLTEIFEAPLALLTAEKGKKVYSKNFKFLEYEYQKYMEMRGPNESFRQYLKKYVKVEEIYQTIDLLNMFILNGINIYQVLGDSKKLNKSYAKITVGTLFTLKGLSFETVYICDDINRTVENAIHNRKNMPKLEFQTIMRSAYVAASRARRNLYNAKFLDKQNIVS